MAGKTREKLQQVVTPVGVAVYPFITRPSTKFDPDGEFKIGVILPKVEAKDLMKTIDTAMKESLEKVKQDNPKKAKNIRLANPPYIFVTDDDGNETGDVQFNFKAKAKITPRTGEPFEKRIALFDATGASISLAGVQVAGGSRVKVSGEIVPYFTDLVGAGVTLRLNAVQIIELVRYDGQSAERYGFGSEEGYVHESTNNDTTEETDVEADF